MSGPDREFWRRRFLESDTPWDRGAANPALTAWLDSGELTPCRILVPGCGTGHEVALLAARGFAVTALDYAPEAVEATRARLAAAGVEAQLIEADALAWQPEEPLEAVYEQTCLCALHPDHWGTYAQQLHRWLAPQGRLFALFMQAARPGGAEGFVEGPPYHCDIHGMRALFPASLWHWPKPPYPRSPHPRGIHELAVCLRRLPAP